MDTSAGWSLSAPNCPVGTKKCDMGAFCCPNSLNCMNSGDAIAEACCPGEDDCVGFLEIGPHVCADPSWSLWNATKATSTSFNYFCCLGSQIGLQSGECGLTLLIGPPPTNVAVPVSTSGLFFPQTTFPTTSGSLLSSSHVLQSTSSIMSSKPSSTVSRSSTSAVPSATGTSGAVSSKSMLRVGLAIQVAVLAIGLAQF